MATKNPTGLEARVGFGGAPPLALAVFVERPQAESNRRYGCILFASGRGFKSPRGSLAGVRPQPIAAGLAASCLAVLSATAFAAEGIADFAVISLIGDRFTVADRSTDARNPVHRGTQVPLGSSAIDGAALVDVGAVLRKRFPDANVSLSLVREPAVYEAQQEVMDATSDTQALVDVLEPIVSRVKARRLLLLAKARVPADVRFENVFRDRPGVLEGLGFYVDGSAHLYDPKSMEKYYGYLGVFVHVRLAVVDVASRKVLDEERVAVMRPTRDPGKDLWESLTADQKVAAIKALLSEQMELAVGRLAERGQLKPAD